MGSGTGVVPGRRHWQRRRRRHGNTSPERVREAGVSLIEVVISVAIIGTAVISIAGAMGASVRHSAQVEGRSEAEAEARRLAEHLRSSVPMAACDLNLPVPRDQYGDALQPVKATGYDVSIAVALWDPGVGYASLDGGGCDGSTHSQQVTVEVTHQATGARASVSIVKRKE